MYILNGVLVIISKIKRKFKSMRLHMLIALMVVGLVPAAILTAALSRSYKDQSINEKLNDVQIHGLDIANKILFSGFLTNATSNEITTQLSLLADQYDGRVLVVDNTLKVISDTFGKEATGKVLLSSDVIKCLRGATSTKKSSGTKRAEVMIPIISSDKPLPLGVIIMNVSLEREYAILSNMGQEAMIYCWIILIVLFIAAFLYSKHMVKPLKAIIASIQHVSDGYMDDEVNILGFTEIEKISDSFNEMLGRMKTLEESRQEFVSNVSHELKTPITSIKVLAESLLTQPDAPVELYREFMTDINEEIERENNIITDLLSLVKLDKKTGEMHIATVSVNELLEIILKRLKPIAMKRNIELVYESFRNVLAEVDEVKLSLAISNLIENAIKYNVDDGWVRVSLNADHKYFYIKVADSGIGIPESAQGNIFDRFYRVDKARARQTGGTGLGLSITKNVVLMHNGAIKVYSQENEGSTFTLRIPLNYIP
ncbi:HAMP domain-containing sensor histidine kinase [Lachnoclostridium phytofermentans]|uniref:histidine kinase n=1 Tax=Lachnoclostridium phytofermentans (strain ATCC 700394 / DSM 18823 / ISDg) TaxID=357809 RepID=A9KHN8_LACP7|nr:HAMP domain-containing sensor histidine kinase [Lachnoclostridium phytofermentans]ABX42323.1 integral membrane sensor signal transduction histidine kinase [Lachnoclostridium phytofermentans ISDg]